MNINQYFSSKNYAYNLSYQAKGKWDKGKGFTVRIDNNEQLFIDSCPTLIKSFESGYQTSNLEQKNSYRTIYTQCKAINLIVSDSENARKSYLKRFHLNLNNIKNFPAVTALVISNEQAKPLDKNEESQYSDFVKIKSISFPRKGEARIFDINGAVQDISIIAKADFNKDNIEDVLLLTANYKPDGSYSASTLFLLTKLANKAMWNVLAIYPESNP
ncbi:hypothetical protein F9817_20530 [Vibrio sp. CAIM 722]|uniref:Uncharacterized protein n=1 Tax=Vibrio eleionomae TaxID=2653505 RepID=A0A7X4LPK9_9VIBR|nr:hypothetical protein [Vibrio eleionomae]MZI95570.1 hypothetical protein [Vibrio eleionomae]